MKFPLDPQNTSEYRIIHLGDNNYMVAEVIPIYSDDEDAEIKYYCVQTFYPTGKTLFNYVHCSGVNDILKKKDLINENSE